MNDQNSSKDVEKARNEVELNRMALDDALNRFESKVIDGTHRIRSFVDKVRKPVDSARGDAFYNLGLFLVCGFVLGSWLGDSVEARGTPELPGERDEPTPDELSSSIQSSETGT